MHKPVLLNEVIKHLDPKSGENIIDCTVGEAGHAQTILERTKPGGKVLGIDVDLETIKRLELGIKNHELRDRLILVNGNFKDLKKIVQENHLEPVNGILFDLGLSSWQIEKGGKGFSFQGDEPLDMRFNPGQQILTATEIINVWPEETLRKVFSEYGEEKYSKKIAKRIIEERKKKTIRTTRELREVIERAVPRGKTRRGQINRVLARIFQALRIAVNDELENLKQGLEQSVEILKSGGRLAVISFHSLEDRIVKNFFREKTKEGTLKILTKKPVGPSNREIQENLRSRSAKLRAAWKNGQA